MTIWKRILCLSMWSVVLIPSSLSAQPDLPGTSLEPRIDFEHISPGKGFLQNTISCILQDQTGFLWIGTEDGLFRYDGYQFKSYTHDPQNPRSLSHNSVLTMYEDHTGVLWIGTKGGGLNALDRETEQFLHYQTDPDNPQSLNHNTVSIIYEDRSGTLWIGTNGGGLNIYNRETGQFSHYHQDKNEPGSLSSNFIRAIYEDRSGELWIGTLGGGLNHFVRKTGKFTHYQHDPDDPYSLSHNAVWAILEDRSGTLWVGTHGGGLNRFDRETQRFFSYLPVPDDPTSLSHHKILSLYEDQSGVIWIGTDGGGLNHFIPRQNQDERTRFLRFYTEPENPRSLSHNIVNAIYEDRSGVLWVGTEGGGLNKFTHKSEKFPHYRNFCDLRNSQGHNVVLSLYEDWAGMLWIGTHREGLIKFDRNTQQCIQYRAVPGNPYGLTSDIILSIAEDRRGNLWVGTRNGGLHRFDRETRRFSRYHHEHDDPRSLSDNSVRVIYEDRSGTLWIGTEGGGLNKFERETEHFVRYQHDPGDPHSLSHNAVWTIYEDRLGILWIGTDEGLNQFNRQTEQFLRYQANPADPDSLSDNNIRSIHEDRSGNLWIGTRGGGLNKFDRVSATFTHYGETEGLPGNVIYGLLGDNHGNLWLSTNNRGIATFDPQAGTCEHFDVSDGLQADVFSVGAYHKSRSGEMFFGGINGFNAFYPDDIGKNSHIPPVIMTDFQLSYTSVGIGDTSPLQQSITVTKEMRLSYQENTVSFEFAALDYTVPEKNQYAYMLEGFENDWIYAGTQRVVTYTSLAPGQYVFKVKGSNNDSIWNEEGISLKLIISPPFWETGWFRVLILVTLVGIAFTVYRMRMRTIDSQKKLLESRVVERTQALQQEIIERKRTEEALQESEELLGNIVESMSDGILVLDRDFHYIYWNRAMERISKTPREEVINNKKVAWEIFPHLAEQGVDEMMRRAMQGEVTQRENIPYRLLDGTTGFTSEILIPLRTITGEIRGIVGVIREVTERKRAEEKLQEAKKAAERAQRAAEAANRAKSEFLANMSHELRTPLNAILGFAQLMGRTPHAPEEQESLDIIQRSGEHLLTLINQVLDLSKIEAGRTTLNEKNFDLYYLLDELYDMFRLKADKKHLHLLFERTDDVPQYVCTDEVKLRQVLINLLSNAVKFTEEGEVRLKIENCQLNIEEGEAITSNRQSSIVNLQFSISDTGSGIAHDELDSLFEAFTQTKAGQKIQEGTGLGLIISQKFVQLMGGGITVKSEVGHGTTFTFDIQVDVVEAGEIESARPTRKVMAIEPGQPRYRMLIVDDEPNNRKLLVSLLTPFGFELQEVSNGQEAIKIWGTWEPHLIWMDMRMPVMDGYEATKYIKSEILNSKSEIQTIIIAVTASSFEEERAVILEAGCDDFLRKPFREQEVFDLLAKHLGVRFVYEEPEQGRKVAGVQEHVPKGVLTPEAIATLPDELRTGLRQAVEVIDMERANSLIEQIRQQNEPLAEGLAELVKNYRFDTLQELFEEIE